MFSERTRWPHATNRLTLAVSARLASGAPLDDLTAANPTRCALPFSPAHHAALASLSAPAASVYTPDARGLHVAREAVAGYYAARGQRVHPERLVLTASTSEAYGWLFKLLCDPGDEVIVVHPSYPLFDDLAKLEGVRLVHAPLVYEARWELDTDAVARAVTPRTRALLLVHPNNPTGSFVRRSELDVLVEICRRHRLAIVSDEVFADHAYAPDAGRVPSFVTLDDVLTFTLSGLSKVVARPQMKLGWIAVSGPRADADEALARLDMIADCYLSVGAPVQHAAAALLSEWQAVRDVIVARVTRNREALRARLSPDSAATLLHAEGGWYATLRVARTLSEEDRAVRLVTRDGVLVHPGYFFDFAREAYLVVSLLPPEDLFSRAIARVIADAEQG